MNTSQKPVVIAFDGTAASGKGSIAKLVAKRCGYEYLDTGLMFRKVACYCIKQSIDFNNVKEVLKVIRATDFGSNISNIDEGEIYSNIVSDVASQIAIEADVRKELLKVQRKFADNKKGIVVDGRDIGTVVFPNADFKFFFDASLEERAVRRYNQLRKRGKEVMFSQVFEYLKVRDKRDKDRYIAPLKKAKGSFEIDTTNSSISEVLDIVLKKIKE